MNVELIVCILLGILLAFSTWMAGVYWKEKEHYRCRVFELTKGEEGSNLVKVVPETPPPPPPKKPNIDDIDGESNKSDEAEEDMTITIHCGAGGQMMSQTEFQKVNNT